MRNRIWLILFTVALVVLMVVFGACTQAQEPKVKPIILKAVSFGDKAQSVNNGLFKLIELVNKRSDGKLTIQWMGGPEVVPQAETAIAIKSRVADLGVVSTSFAAKLIPALGAIALSTLSSKEEKASGFRDILDAECKKLGGSHYLGMATGGQSGFVVLTKYKVANPRKDFQGHKFRSYPGSDDFFKSLGINILSMPQSEVYTALQTGLIDGTVWALPSLHGSGLSEVVKYWIEHQFYNTAPPVLINLDAWNQIPKDLQEIVAKSMDEGEAYGEQIQSKQDEDERQIMRSAGVEFIKFSADDAKWYLDQAYAGSWTTLEKQAGAEITNKIRAALTKSK